MCGEIPYAHASLLIEALDGFFADFGTPEEILWDNRKQFDCVEFNRFCASRQVWHLTSSPDVYVKNVPGWQDIVGSFGSDLFTPVWDQLPSLSSRHLRGSLPFLPSALTPWLISSSLVQQQLRRLQREAHFQNVRHTDVRSSALFVDKRVRARVNSWWQKGAIEKVCVEPNSYLVRLSDGRLFRRTRWAINIDYSSSSSLPESHQPFPAPVPDRAVSFPPSKQPTPVPEPPLPAGLSVGCSTPSVLLRLSLC